MTHGLRPSRAAVAVIAALVVASAATASATMPTTGRAVAGDHRVAIAGTSASRAQTFDAAPVAVPVFRVGTAVVDIDPPPGDPQYLGGFGTMSHPTARVLDPLEVRAFVIRRGTTTVALAAVDSQGWFLASADGPYGIDSVRSEVAGWLRRHGSPGATPANVIVSATHSHAAPTVMGIWGPPNPRYEGLLRDATVHAIEVAATRTQPAQLWTADADIADVIGHNVNQTDLYDGWSIDSKLPILWARDPRSGATIGLYANVPVHADIVDGSQIDAMSADHIGVARRAIEHELGGTAILAMGTLGRQESIVQAKGPVESQRVGDFVANRIRWALGAAAPVTDGTLAAASIGVSVPATGVPLLALQVAGRVAPRQPLPVLGNYGVRRATTPPYQDGATIGTVVSGFRLGDLLYLTEPGEAFPEVSSALRRQAPGARVRLIGMALDQLGYYYPVADAVFTTFTTVTGSDHLEYNVSVLLAAATQSASAAVAQRLGFRTSPGAKASAGPTDPTAPLRPGVQFFAVPPQGQNRTVLFDVSWNRALDGTPLAGEGRAPVAWSFGDGSGTRSSQAVNHTYAHPGTYQVQATVSDTKGRTRSYAATVEVGVPPPALPALPPVPVPQASHPALRVPTPSTYRAGSAERSIDPAHDQLASGRFFLGGYGLGNGEGLAKIIGSGRRATGVLDHLAVRALVVDDGRQAIAMAQIDTQGWFATYRDGPWGSDAIRRDAAERVRRTNPRGDPLPASAILVNSTHTHAGPDTVGAWGGVPSSYLQLVHDRAVDAIVAAWRSRQPVHLLYGAARGGVAEQGDPNGLIHNQLGSDPANSAVDDEVRVLQARSARTGAVVVTYVNFSAHPTVLGSGNTLLSADYPGAVSRKLSASFGGMGFDQVGTLGRTQPNDRGCPDPTLHGSAKSRCQLDAYASRVMSKVNEALAHAAPLTGPPVVAMHTYTISDASTNPALLALLEAGSGIGAGLLRGQQPTTVAPLVTTHAVSGRIGSVLISGSPGEPYPQIPLAVRSATPGMSGYLSIGTADDFLGYLVAPAGAYPGVVAAAATGNDNLLFNSSLTIGQRVECALLRGAGEVTGRGGEPLQQQPVCALYQHR